MRHAHRLPLAVAVAGAILALSGAASAQDKRLEDIARANQRFGADDVTFRRFLAEIEKRNVQEAPSTTVEELADQVSELRISLAPDRRTVIGEVAITGRTRLSRITLQLEEGPVTFTDDGVAPDKQKGDGVFSARLRTSPDTIWQSMRQSMKSTARVAAAPGRREFIRRGPRDLVPADQFIDTVRRNAPAMVESVTASTTRLAPLMEARSLVEGARLANFDPVSRPFLILPARPPREPKDFFFPRFFDIPVIPRIPFPFPNPSATIDKDKSLMVIHPGVVEDTARTFDACTNAGTPGGPWTFGHLMREMSFGTGMNPQDYALHWLSTWIVAQEANGFIVNEPGRGNQLRARVIDSWQRLSGGPSAPLDIDKFPARLLAIVNRPDLADKIGYGVAGSAGEGRFVFGLLEKDSAGNCNSLPFTVIFEYGIAGGTCSAVKAWHQRWKDLDTFALGSTQYNDGLALIARDFTEHGTNPAQAPNQNSLNQLRTNEIALGSVWQLREFRLQSSGAVPPGVLDLVTVKQTPDDGFMNSATAASFIINNEADILGNKHKVPERFPTIFDPFLGAKSDVPFPPDNVFWNPPGLVTPPMQDAPEARRKFSLNTCNACHGGETKTFFTHIGATGTRQPGQPADLSGFLTGIDVTVTLPFTNTPLPGTWPRHYEDLAERQIAMNNILTNSCFALLGVRRIPFVH